MKLLKNRPLAAFCLIFIFTAFITHNLEPRNKLFIILALLLCLLCTLFLRKGTHKRIFSFLCLSFALLAVLSQLIGIDMRRQSAQDHVGERKVLMLVTAEDTSFNFSNEYSVEIREIDGKRVFFSSTLVTDPSLCLERGDLIYTEASISPSQSDGIFINTAIYEDDTCVIISKNNLSFKILFDELKQRISEHMDNCFGEELSALARGFLLSDRSDISAEVIKDFRRSGLSHLLAVSGFHISILLAFSELILRALSIPKRPRCILISLIALIFLGTTGFALSACRSVIMLISVYFCFLFTQEYDSLSALFLSVSLIILISPFSVRDVGLWLSFLATLAIIAVYSPLSSYFKSRKSKSISGFFISLSKKLLLSILLTFVCNIFICIVIWLVFGEISLVAILSNPLVAPISSLFVILIPIAAVAVKLPFLGRMLVYLLSQLSKLILAVCEFFSDIPGAVLSLRYPFAPFIIILMTVSLAVMLLVELKKKWTILYPPLIACALFAVCLIGYNALCSGRLEVSYHAEDDNEVIIITKGRSASICDLSYAPNSFLYDIPDIYAERMATEISGYTVTHYHTGHALFLERLFKENLVERVNLPHPVSSEEREIAADIVRSANISDVKVYFYTDAEKLSMQDGSYLSVIRYENERKHPSVCAVVGYGDSILTYLNSDLSQTELIDRITLNSNFIIFGRHGDNFSQEPSWKTDPHILRTVIFADQEIYARSELELGDASVYLPSKYEKKLFFELVLD